MEGNKMTVVELKAMAKQKGLSGYSKLKKQELIQLLGLNKVVDKVQNKTKNTHNVSKKNMTVLELKALAKKEGFSGYSKLKKQELIDLLASPPRKAASPPRKAASPPRKAASPPRKAASPPRKAASPIKEKVDNIELNEMLLDAVDKEDYDLIDTLLIDGAYIDYLNIIPRTRFYLKRPLLLAIDKNNLKLIKFLVERGASIKGALQHAVKPRNKQFFLFNIFNRDVSNYGYNMEIIKYFLSIKVDNNDIYDTILQAEEYKYQYPELIDFLMKSGVVFTKHQKYELLLSTFNRRYLREVNYDYEDEILKLFLRYRFNVNYDSGLILFDAIVFDYPKSLEILIKYGSPTKRNIMNVYNFAKEEKKDDCVELLTKYLH